MTRQTAPVAAAASARRAGRRAGCPAAPAGRWLIDAERSTLQVSVKVGLFATVHGTFADVTGHVELAANPVESRVEVTVATSSLSSGSSCMDALLHGANLVDSSRNPSIDFVSRAIRPGTGSAAGCWTGCWPPTERCWTSRWP